EVERLIEDEAQAHEVVGQPGDGGNLGVVVGGGDDGVEVGGVETLDLDGGVGERVGRTQQGEALVPFEVAEREDRVDLEVDLTVEDLRLAGGAVALPAAVGQAEPGP